MKEYIEREAAIFDLEIFEKQVIKNEYALAIAGCRSHIRNIPAADVVEVRHGRWEHNDDGYGCEVLWWCSACKEKFVLIEGTPRDNGYYYCPNCGAKMDGGSDDV